MAIVGQFGLGTSGVPLGVRGFALAAGDRIIEIGVLRRLEPLAYQERESATDIRSKISGDQIVRTPAAANVDLGSGGAYPITIGIERVQKT
jgi:hypothetical protein